MDAGEQEALLVALVEDPGRAELEAADHALVRYALKLTRTPAAVAAADIEELRRVGFDDRAIHDLCAIVAYFAFVNRIADGLGVEMEGSGAGG